MKFTFSKILALLMVLCMLCSLVACNNTPADNNQPPVNDGGNDQSEEPSFDFGDLTSPTGKIKNVIFIIGDGMGKNHIEAGVLDKGSEYGFMSWQRVDVNTDSRDKTTGELTLTDSAASATALATGTLTVNSYVGKNPGGESLVTIMDLAKHLGKATGVLTTDYLYGATPAGFSAHALDRDDKKTITKTQLLSGINFLGGLNASVYEQSMYKTMIESSPYYFAQTLDDSSIMDKEQVMLALDIENGKDNSVSLSDATKTALSYLEKDEDGFMLMIEQAYIDKESHNNEIDDMISRMHSLGETVETVMEWVGDRDDTVVLVSADHETGGLSVSKTENLGKTYAGNSGNFYYKWESDDHTQSYVSLYVYGTTETFYVHETFKDGTLIKNVDIFAIMKRLVTTGE